LFKKYFTKQLLYNLLIALGIMIVLLLVVQSGLKTYTRHGESIAVPDLRGKSFEEIKTILKGKNLEWQIEDSVYDGSIAPMAVVDQNPKANSKVKEGRTIYVTINATMAPTTEIPDLVGRSSLKYAKMQLESYGLKVGETIYRPDPNYNAVIGIQIKGRNITKKTRVPKGTIVDLILGDGLGNSKISVPYLIGLRYDEAEFKLKGYSLNIGAVVTASGVTDTASAIIYKQVPEYGPGKTIRMGEPIDLFIAKELPEGITVNPALYDAVDTVESK
jgi:eukaryotic-like serine/threonine-protein kinase